MKTVIVPKSCQSKTVPYPVQENGNHASAIVCISPVGISCKPLFTVPRAALDPQIYDDLPLDSFEVVHTDSGYVNTAVFSYWLTNIFIPTLREKREQYNYHGKSVLILDGFVGHTNALDQIDLDDENLIIHYLVPHTSDMLQQLDVGVFGSMKRFMSNCKNIGDVSYQTKQLFKIHQSLYQACSPANCKTAFAATGIVTKPEKIGDITKEIAHFDFRKSIKVRYYEIPYMSQIARYGGQLTNIQRYIYLSSLYPVLETTARTHLADFETKRK